METSICMSYPCGTVVWIFNDDAKFSKHIMYKVSLQGEDIFPGHDSVWFNKDDKVVRIETHDGIFWEDANWVSAGQQGA